MTSIRDLQAAAWANKQAKGFNTTDVAREFHLLRGEVDEAEDAWRTNLAGLAHELADVFIYLAGLAQMNDIDLQDAVTEKLAIVQTRTYVRDAVGRLVKAAS